MQSGSGRSSSLHDRIARLYYRHGLFCATHPYSVIFLTLCVAALCCSPLLQHPVLGSLSQQFYSPLHKPSDFDSEQTDEGYASRAPRWFHSSPIAYVQQIIIKSAVSPWQQNMLITDAFRAPIAQVFHLVETINNFQVFEDGQNGQQLSLDQLCLQVEEPVVNGPKEFLPKYGCLTLSPTWVWKNDISRFREDSNILKAICDKKGHNFGSLQEVLFGVPWSESGIKKIIFLTRQRVLTYAVTLVFKKLNPNYINGLRQHLLDRYPSSPSSTVDPENTNSVQNIYYEDQFTLAEFIPLGVTYIILFLYIYFSVSKLDLLKYKWVLAVSAVFTVMMSLLMSVGLCIWFGLNTTLNGSMSFSEILPYLVVVIGLENILVLTKSVVSTSPHLDVKIRIAQGLSKEGWSITKNLFTELALLTFAFFTFVPAIQEFCLFAVVGLLSDFFLQMLFFVTVLSIDIRRMEDGGKGNTSKNVNGDEEEEDERSGNSLNRQLVNGPALRRVRFSNSRMRAPVVPYNTTPYSTSVFAPPTTPIFAKLPKRLRFFEFWARTRMVQRGLMVCLVLWISLLVYNSGLVEHLTENATQIAPSFTFQVPPALRSIISSKDPENQSIPPGQHTASPEPSLSAGPTFEPAIETRILQSSWSKRSLPDQHWATLFGYYNISLLRRYLSILPPVHLYIPVSPSVALQWRHSADTDPTLRSFFLAYIEKLPEGEDDANPPQAQTGSLLPLAWNYRPTNLAEVVVVIALGLPTLIFLIYLLVLLYRCICPRHYAEWRSSWKREGALWEGACPQSQDLDPDTYLIMETLPLRLKSHIQEIEEFASDENILCSVCLAGDIRVWDTMSGECLTTINRSLNQRVTAPTGSFSSDSTYSSSQPADEEVGRPSLSFHWTHNIHHNMDEGLCHHHHHSVDSGMSSPTAGTKGDIHDNHFQEPFNPSQERQQKPRISEEGNMQEARREQVSPLEYQPVWCMAMKGSWLVLGCAGGRIELWDVFTGCLLCVNTHSNVGVTALCLDKNRSYVARMNGVLEFFLIDVCESSPDEEIHPSIDTLESIEIHQSKSCREHAKLVWWHSLRAHTSPITALSVFGGHLLTGSQDHFMKVFYCETGTLIYSLHGHSAPISAFHVDQASPSWVASGCQNGLVCVWDLITGTCMYGIQAHQGAVLSLATTPCYLVTLGANDRICFWEKTQGHPLHTVRQHALCPELALLTNNILVTANHNHLVLWDINYGEAIRVVPLDSEEPHLNIQRLRLVGRAIVCSYGSQLCVVHFPAMTEKGD